MYQDPKHRKLKERTLRFDPYHDEKLCQVAESLGLQPAVLGARTGRDGRRAYG